MNAPGSELDPRDSARLFRLPNGAVQERPPKSRIGHYDLIQKLGAGEMGNVYRARQWGIDRDVVIKVLPQRLQEDTRYLKRFYREAKAAGRIQHVNIVKAIHVGQSESGRHYFVMEHVKGENLKEVLDRGEVFEERRAIDVMIQVVRALVHGHSLGLFHGEIRPENIRLTTNQIVKLSGLGLAKELVDHSIRRTRVLLTASHYVSPEEVRGEDKDIRSDIYSLGATLYHMITGKTPFAGGSAVDVLARRLTDQLESPRPFNPNISDSLCHVLEYMLARDPADRYPTPQDLLIDLELIREGSAPISKRIPSEKSSLKRIPARPSTPLPVPGALPQRPATARSTTSLGHHTGRARTPTSLKTGRAHRFSPRWLARRKRSGVGRLVFFGLAAALILTSLAVGLYFVTAPRHAAAHSSQAPHTPPVHSTAK